MPGIHDFIGVWQLRRHVEDRRQAETWTFRGQAAFRRAGADVVCDESGWIGAAGRPPLRAERSYLWRALGGLIEVRFADGRPFHRFDPRHPAPEAEHACGADLYRVRYALGTWPHWRTVWEVSGPRKDISIVSHFAPACATFEAGAEPGEVSAE